MTRREGSAMNNPSVISVKFCLRGLTISSAICLLALSGCSSVGGLAGNHGATTNLLMRHTENSQERPEISSSDPEPDYEWWY
jgi:hypothetical protein